MKLIFALTAAVSLTLPAAAIAGDTAVADSAAASNSTLSLRTRALVKTTDGRKVGFIERVVRDAAGAPTAVQIIYNGRFVQIPASTLAPAEKGLVTSLTAKEVGKL